MSDCKHEHTYLTDAGYFNACESCDEPVSAEGGRIAVAFERIAELEAQVEASARVVAAAKDVLGALDSLTFHGSVEPLDGWSKAVGALRSLRELLEEP